MKFDYCAFENETAQTVEIDVGCRFADEPDELYVIQISLHQDGVAQGIKLLFNGLDCKYLFKPEEKALIADYVQRMLAATIYATWFEGSLVL